MLAVILDSLVFPIWTDASVNTTPQWSCPTRPEKRGGTCQKSAAEATRLSIEQDMGWGERKPAISVAERRSADAAALEGLLDQHLLNDALAENPVAGTLQRFLDQRRIDDAIGVAAQLVDAVEIGDESVGQLALLRLDVRRRALALDE